MPRNGGGVYALPEPPFVSGTVISSTEVNNDFSDIADALTDSIASDGQTPITGSILFFAGTENAPGISWLVDPNTGRYRPSAGEMADVCDGTTVAEYSDSGVNFPVGASVGGISLALPVGLGPLPWSGLTAPTGWLLCYGQALSRTTYAALWAFAQTEIAGGNTLFTVGDGSTTFTIPDMRGRLPAGKDNMGGSAANRLTVTTITPNGNTMGGVGGAQSQTLQLGQLPTGISSNNLSSIPLSVLSTISNITFSPNAFTTPGGANGFFGVSSQGSVTSTGSLSIGAVTVTSNNTFGGAHENVQPTIITNYIIYAGA